jgi:ligand-binding sensor domain-containing protein
MMNRFIPILLIAILLFTAHSAFSQGLWKHYTNELPGVVFDMAQDKYDNYWFATMNGVCELDTNGFWHYLVDTTVWDSTMYFKNQIEIDQKNNKWFVGLAMSHPFKEYVVKYNDSTFTYYNPSGREDETWIYGIGVDSSGNIWAGSLANWVYRFDGMQWHPFFVPGTFWDDPVGGFATDRRGTLYICHVNGISTLYGWLWGESGVSSIAFDKNNHLWFGTGGWGLGKYDGQNWMRYTTNDGLLSNIIVSVAVDSNQNIWTSYSEYAKGISQFNGSLWQHMTHKDGLLDDAVGILGVDKNGNIWFKYPFVKAISVFTDTTSTRIKFRMEANILPKMFELHQNCPNPFNSKTMICYELHQESDIELSIITIKGEELSKLISDKQQAGLHQILWNGKDKFGKEASSGIYLYSLRTDSFIETKKMILIR